MVFLGLAILITALLAISLSQMELQPGMPAPLLEGYRIIVPEYSQTDPINLSVFHFILRLLGVLSVLYLLLILYRVIMGTSWKKLLRIMAQFSLILGAFLLLILGIFLLRNISSQSAKLTASTNPIGPPLAIRTESVPTVVIWLVGISLAALASLLLLYWRRAHRRLPEGNLFAEQIEKARQNILDGMSLDEVILRCYLEMGLKLQQEGGIERQAFTTPTEFESELYAAGLPKTPVHELTHLFESVRYGHRTSTPSDEQEALSNLQKIITHLREKKAAVNDE